MIPNLTSPFTLLDARAYLKDLTASVKKAKTRINLISLVLADDSYTHELIEALIEAAGRGVIVNIAVDAFTYSEFGGYFSPFKRMKRRSRAASAMAKRLQAAGIRFTWLGNEYKFNPFAGVTHLKWTIVDDTTYAFGGTNLFDEGIEGIDFMLKSIRPDLAEQISLQHQAIVKSDNSPLPYLGYASQNDFGTVYIDSGRPHESIIYDRLCELAQLAEHILAVTQYCPDGSLANYLRGKSDIYYNQPRNTPFPVNVLIGYGELRTGLRSQYTHPVYLHTKFMIFTMPGGEKITLTGSHNFSHTGVVFGTREIALETNDPHVIKQLEDFYKKYIQ